MRHWALITGASSGIGEAYAHGLAKRGYNVLLVARREHELRNLCDLIPLQYEVEAEYYCADLIVEEERNALCEYVKNTHDVSVLVNNAGMGVLGEFSQENRLKQLNTISLNVYALVDITSQLLGSLESSEHETCYVINIGSVAGFQPGPYMAVYYATKGFVLHFSEALAYELSHAQSKVVVSVVCPGPTKSEFGTHAGFVSSVSQGTSFFSRMRKNVGNADMLVEYSLTRIFKAHKTVVIHGFFFKIMIFLNRMLSRKSVVAVVARIQSKRRKKNSFPH